MPDLSEKGSHQYWHDYKDNTIYRVISFMESVEDWTLDGNPALEEAMARLGEVLDDVGGIELKQEDQFVRVCAYIKAGRALRLMQALDTAYPGAASKLLMYAEESTLSSDDIPGLFLRRNIVFERLRLLSRVFAPERIKLVLRALEDQDND